MPRAGRQQDTEDVHRAHVDTLDRIEQNVARLHGEVQSAARTHGSPRPQGRTAEGTQMHPGLYPGNPGQTQGRFDDAIYHPYGTQGHLAEVEIPHAERPEERFGAQGRGRNMAPYTAAALGHGGQGVQAGQGAAGPVQRGNRSIHHQAGEPLHEPPIHQTRPPFLHTHAGASPPMSQVGLPRRAQELRAMNPMERTPPLTIVDQDNVFRVEAELPGVNKDDLDVEAYERWIDIVAEVRPSDAEGRVIVSDRRPVLYETRIALPAGIKPTEVKAALKDGILELTLPKKKAGGGRHQVDVQ